MKGKWMKIVRQYTIITLGISMMAVGVYFFKFPNNFVFGGVTGAAALVAKLTPISASEFSAVVNMLMLLLGLIFLGKEFALTTGYATVVLSAELMLLEKACPLNEPLSDQPMLELIFAIALPAIASALLFSVGASSGGIGPMLYFARPGNGSLLHFVRPVFSGKALLKACTNGSSELMTNLSASLVGALYNWQLLRLGGADGVAAYGVIMYVSFFFAAIFIGYAQGCAPVVSYHYGADNTDELKNLLRISLRVIAVGGVAMLCFSELLATPLSRFFVGYDAELLELTTLGMKLYSLSFLLCGFNIFGSAFFTALNNGIVSAVISFLRTLVFQVTAILVLPHLLGMNGIWLSVVAAEIAALFVNAFFLVKNRKKYQY
jgi:O-antigen/teichoic acid export membrane protein